MGIATAPGRNVLLQAEGCLLHTSWKLNGLMVWLEREIHDDP